jgi:phosphatidylglycerophosphate synthase
MFCGFRRQMLDARLRPWIDPPLDRLARPLVQAGVTAEAVTWAGCALGLGGATAVAAGWSAWGLVLFALGRLADGLDGAVARRTSLTDRGGFLDIVCDFLVYAAVPLAFAVADPATNALAACALLASFIVSGVTFLAFATVAAKRGLTTQTQGRKAIYYLSGLAEGAETIAVLAAMMIWPAWFPVLAWGFAALCAVSSVARVLAAMKAFGAP